jgi:nucleoid-associated protein YgaU
VVEGDTLSEIAQQHLDDAEAWPRIFEASRGFRSRTAVA